MKKFSQLALPYIVWAVDYSEEGQEVGLTFFPEDIHVMSKVGY